MAELIVTAVEFETEAVHLTWCSVPDDLRAGGALQAVHQLMVADNGDYGDGIEDLRRAARALLVDALEDYASTDPVDPATLLHDNDDDDDDDG